MFSDIRDRLDSFFDSLIPTKKLTFNNSRFDQPALARSLDVDRVHQILLAAENGDVTDLMSLYRDIVISDNHIQGEFAKRKLAVLGDVSSVHPANKKLPLDVSAAQAMAYITDHDSALIAWSHLLDATLYPVALVEKVFSASNRPGVRYEVAKLIPVPHELLDYTEGTLMLWDVDPNGMRLGTKHAPDSDRYIIHRGHLLTYSDKWGGPMRSLVFWWLLSAMDRDWWARFLERFGAPFVVAKYDQSDDSSRLTLQSALSAATRLFGLVVSKETQIELVQAASSQSGDAFEKFHNVCQREKSKLILGQTLSAEAKSTGLGSGVAKSQENVRSDYRDFDAMMLGATIRRDLFKQIARINRLAGELPSIMWGSVATAQVESIAALLTSLAQSGLQIGDDGLDVLSEQLGYPIQRSALSSAPKSPLTFAARVPPKILRAGVANDDIAREGAASLAQAFRGSLAPIRQIILSSPSPEECERQIKVFYADWSPARVAPLIEEALVAYAANGATAAAR